MKPENQIETEIKNCPSCKSVMGVCAGHERKLRAARAAISAKVVQIAVAAESEAAYGQLFILKDDGRVWVKALRPSGEWELMDLP